MKTTFEFNPDFEAMVAEHFPNWQDRLKEAARDELLNMLIAAMEVERKKSKKLK